MSTKPNKQHDIWLHLVILLLMMNANHIWIILIIMREWKKSSMFTPNVMLAAYCIIESCTYHLSPETSWRPWLRGRPCRFSAIDRATTAGTSSLSLTPGPPTKRRKGIHSVHLTYRIQTSVRKYDSFLFKGITMFYNFKQGMCTLYQNQYSKQLSTKEKQPRTWIFFFA